MPWIEVTRSRRKSEADAVDKGAELALFERPRFSGESENVAVSE